jgi:hypothetical protein
MPGWARADNWSMRSLAGVLLVYALSMLLASTSPVGTGQGVHQFQLVDELLPHVHIVNGQRIEVGGAQPASATSSPEAGPALGAAAGAAGAITPGVVLTPSMAQLVVARPAGQRVLAADAKPPVARTEAPPVRPPLVQS